MLPLPTSKEVYMFSFADLAQFYGTACYHHWSAGFPNVVLTDGAQFVAEHGGRSGAYWLMDAIASHQSSQLLDTPFQCWTLEVHEDNSAVLICQDGCDREVVRQEIRYTDIGVSTLTLWVEEGSPNRWSPIYRVIMLPSEH
jgi:hypothetical protein